MSWLDRLEKIHNRASDTTFVWFPFTRLRPAASEEIRFERRVVMSLAFGVYYGAFFALKGALFNDRPFFESILSDVIGAIALFFVWFNAVTAPLWNRRARRFRNRLNHVAN